MPYPKVEIEEGYYVTACGFEQRIWPVVDVNTEWSATKTVTGIGGVRVKLLSGAVVGGGMMCRGGTTYCGAISEATGTVTLKDPTGATIATATLPLLSPLVVDNVDELSVRCAISVASSDRQVAARANAHVVWKVV